MIPRHRRNSPATERILAIERIAGGTDQGGLPYYYVATDAQMNHLGTKRKQFKRYGGVIGPKLHSFMESLQEGEMHDISEEVIHVRTVHAQNVAWYDAIFNLPELAENATQKEKDDRRLLMSAANDLLRASADDVTRIVERSAKIVNLVAGKMHPGVLDSLTRQITGFVYRIFDNEEPGAEERMRLFDEALTKELELPSLAGIGTAITPDQQVTAMDSAIPSAPEDD